jgi:hypothetical protein
VGKKRGMRIPHPVQRCVVRRFQSVPWNNLRFFTASALPPTAGPEMQGHIERAKPHRAGDKKNHRQGSQYNRCGPGDLTGKIQYSHGYTQEYADYPVCCPHISFHNLPFSMVF